MRATLRLLATVRPAGKYLQPGQPTGLTGLDTHPAPRSALLYLYHTTLEKLQQAPEHSVYRQSVEALTKHRLALVEAAVPPGYEEWAAKAREVIKDQPENFKTASHLTQRGVNALKVERGDGHVFVMRKLPEEKDPRLESWDGDLDGVSPPLEGSRTEEERAEQNEILELEKEMQQPQVELEAEPQLTAEQIQELETKIGAGLIEEVIEVAEGELKLVDTMVQAKVWEPLVEQPNPGQWVYFERQS
ncbi:ETC complex I subunit conserved region-domain-containing protein [Podospora australis]|uniref:ETC complex I subunit conserved region-domain-containing protein n=1 Tax=Podospora australis TaxID=1536484 RepID=A0AAN6X404_9PEZI|nr:ETC complex I subunit conserved region-domain-containing protein [Podospora australis]